MIVPLDMTPTKPPPRGFLPFDAASIGREIEAVRKRKKIPVAELHGRVGINPRTHWYAKRNGKPAFTIHEIAKIAVAFEAPVRGGWPIVPWDMAWTIQRYLDRLESESQAKPEP